MLENSLKNIASLTSCLIYMCSQLFLPLCVPAPEFTFFQQLAIKRQKSARAPGTVKNHKARIHLRGILSEDRHRLPEAGLPRNKFIHWVHCKAHPYTKYYKKQNFSKKSVYFTSWSIDCRRLSPSYREGPWCYRQRQRVKVPIPPDVLKDIFFFAFLTIRLVA